ncbi:LmeA family phospholipid-binding protein [Streptomyces sp. NPDC006285]|uniref:LmeA family phospholipid-binding protein n=1 Tax=Streptomyces sp. NPDC006285 TaxID=3364742 RepID=UPI0036AB6A43
MKKRRRLVIAAICLTTVAAAAGVTDLVVEHEVRQKVSKAAACRLDAKAVDVELGDTLAGLRTLTGKVGTVHLSADGVKHKGTSVDIDVSLLGVSTEGHASGGTATATVGYDELGKRAPDAESGMKLGTDGSHLTMTGSAGAAGMPITVVTNLSTSAHGVTITPTTISVLGRQLPVGALSSMPGASQVADKLKPRTFDLGSLPAGIKLTGAHAAAGGLVLEFGLSPDAMKESGKKTTACA